MTINQFVREANNWEYGIEYYHMQQIFNENTLLLICSDMLNNQEHITKFNESVSDDDKIHTLYEGIDNATADEEKKTVAKKLSQNAAIMWEKTKRLLARILNAIISVFKGFINKIKNVLGISSEKVVKNLSAQYIDNPIPTKYNTDDAAAVISKMVDKNGKTKMATFDRDSAKDLIELNPKNMKELWPVINGRSVVNESALYKSESYLTEDWVTINRDIGSDEVLALVGLFESVWGTDFSKRFLHHIANEIYSLSNMSRTKDAMIFIQLKSLTMLARNSKLFSDLIGKVRNIKIGDFGGDTLEKIAKQNYVDAIMPFSVLVQLYQYFLDFQSKTKVAGKTVSGGDVIGTAKKVIGAFTTSDLGKKYSQDAEATAYARDTVLPEFMSQMQKFYESNVELQKLVAEDIQTIDSHIRYMNNLLTAIMKLKPIT